MKVGILGVGKLGLCFALNLERAGFEVVGVDIYESYVQSLNKKSFQSPEPGVNDLLQSSSKFKVTTDVDELNRENIELIFLMVATPSTPEGTYNHEQIERVTEKLISIGRRPKKTHLAVACTTMPGYCDTLAKRLEPLNIEVSYNPEFIAQGSVIHDQQYPDQVLIGEASKEAGDLIQSIYEKMCENEPAFCRMDRLSAEICKLATNCFLTTKISFANSVGDLARSVGADEEKILKAIGSDSRVGHKYLKYGFGYGGPCLSRDNRALGIYADMVDNELKISKATDDANHQHLDFQFNEYLEKYSLNQVIEFDYVSYKQGSVSIEESQQLALAVKLAQAGRKVLVRDRKEVLDQVEELYPGLFIFQTVKVH